MFCNQCGKEIKDDEAFCPYCGKETSLKRIDDYEEKPETPIYMYAAFAVLGVVIIGAVVFIFFFLKNDKRPTAKEPGAAVQTESVQDAAETAGTDDLAAETAVDAIVEQGTGVAVDIDAVNTKNVEVTGTLSKDDNAYCLVMDSPKSIYVMNTSGKAQLHDNISYIYLASGEAGSVSGYEDWELTVKGPLVVQDGKIYIVTDEISKFTSPEIVAETAGSAADKAASDEDFIIPDSSSREISKSELRGLSKHDLMLARNEIYARNGRLFDDEELQNYFNSKDWYDGHVKPNNFTESMLSSIERRNIDTIVNYEREMGYR